MRARVWQTVLCSGFFFSCDKISKNVLIFGLHEIVLSKLSAYFCDTPYWNYLSLLTLFTTLTIRLIKKLCKYHLICLPHALLL
jgi:hypothetical protein